MYCSDQQIRLITVINLFHTKTGYGRLDTAKTSDNSLWSLSRSRSLKLLNVSQSERTRSIFSQNRAVSESKVSDSVHLCSVVHPHHVIRVTELLEQSLIQSLFLTHHCYSLSCVYILTFTTVITSQHGLRLITVTGIRICIILSCIFLHWICIQIAQITSFGKDSK